MTIHENLRLLRQNTGMTQEQVAQRIGLTRQALSSYESGRTHPDIEMLMKLAQVYDTDLEGILYGESKRVKGFRQITHGAQILFALLTLLTLIGSSFLWIANRFFPVAGLIGTELKEAFAIHHKWTRAWELTDGLILTTTLIGLLVLLILLAAKKHRISLKTKLLYAAALCAAPFAAALPFALTDPVFAPVNYFITPMYVSARIIVFLLLHLVIDRVINRTKN